MGAEDGFAAVDVSDDAAAATGEPHNVSVRDEVDTTAGRLGEFASDDSDSTEWRRMMNPRPDSDEAERERPCVGVSSALVSVIEPRLDEFLDLPITRGICSGVSGEEMGS
jgi:hypothetical protein